MILTFIKKIAGPRHCLVIAAILIAFGISGHARAASGRPDFSRLVIVGDSLSAGFQNFSLFDSASMAGLPPGGQRYSFASVIAKQAGVDLALPLFTYPGIPPALRLTPSGIVAETGFGTREDFNVQATNLSVPGLPLADVLGHAFPGDPQTNAIDALADLILGVPGGIPGCGPIPTGPTTLIVSEVACAQALNPTTILVSAGNNDALQSLTFGLPPTDPQAFAADYERLLSALTSTGATVVVADIPDVTIVPFLIPGPSFYAQCGFLPQGATLADYMVPNISNLAAGFNFCTNYSIRSAALIGQAQQAVVAYNQIISTLAGQHGVTVVSFNRLFADIAEKGYVVGGRRLTTSFLGGLFSLDGVHPTNTANAILANEFIKTMNRVLHAGIPPVSVETVAKTDPLLPAAH